MSDVIFKRLFCKERISFQTHNSMIQAFANICLTIARHQIDDKPLSKILTRITVVLMCCFRGEVGYRLKAIMSLHTKCLYGIPGQLHMGRCILTYHGQNEMATNYHRTFSNEFPRMKMIEFCVSIKISPKVLPMEHFHRHLLESKCLCFYWDLNITSRVVMIQWKCINICLHQTGEKPGLND